MTYIKNASRVMGKDWVPEVTFWNGNEHVENLLVEYPNDIK
jgi:hypothetical protein